MSKEMIFKISASLQEKIAEEYAKKLSEITQIKSEKILRGIGFDQHGFSIDADRIDITSTEKEKLIQVNKLISKSRLFRSRDFSLEKPDGEKRFRFEREKLEQIKRVKKDDGLQR